MQQRNCLNLWSVNTVCEKAVTVSAGVLFDQAYHGQLELLESMTRWPDLIFKEITSA